MKKYGIVILSLCIFLVACEKEEEYSEIPAIKYKDFIFEIEDKAGFINQVGFLTFDFVDGDGDIGFSQNSDTIMGDEIYDVLLYGYTKVNGEFILTDTSSNALLPFFEEGIYRKYLKGKMKVRIYINPDQIDDTIKYDFQIMDRAYNLSNLGSSPELIIPEMN